MVALALTIANKCQNYKQESNLCQKVQRLFVFVTAQPTGKQSNNISDQPAHVTLHTNCS